MESLSPATQSGHFYFLLKIYKSWIFFNDFNFSWDWVLLTRYGSQSVLVSDQFPTHTTFSQVLFKDYWPNLNDVRKHYSAIKHMHDFWLERTGQMQVMASDPKHDTCISRLPNCMNFNAEQIVIPLAILWDKMV